MKRAVFAVVGHPNKGKSSIVSTLTRNETVAVSQRSGTTQKSEKFRVETENGGFELVDTPGFQRPVKVLAWLKKQGVDASGRASAVARFIADPECQQQFPDEIELLSPLVAGAAILYVVDGSRPYGAEYEAEMEILQWTGQPSMALINPIESETHVEAWQNALSQYFRTVRVFNPMTEEFEKQLALLETFGHLRPEWQELLTSLVADLRLQRQQQVQHSAIILARLAEDLCNYQCRQKALTEEQAKSLQPLVEKRYNQWMRQRELTATHELMALYQHRFTQMDIESLAPPTDLFDCDQWFLWGLSKKELAIAAGAAGATAGAMADLAVGGASFLLGTVVGGAIGVGGTLLGAEKLAHSRVKNIPVGGYEACYGPVRHPNFAYVVIGRFVYLHRQLSRRNHANRAPIAAKEQDLTKLIEQLAKAEKKALHQACARLSQQKAVDGLSDILEPLLQETGK